MVHRVPLSLVYDCAHVDRLIQRVTYAHMLHPVFELTQEFTCDILLHQQA
jgi:hypothetical protein